jgi:uncharacterized membrane protein
MATQIASGPRMKSITVDGTPAECYRAWRDMEGLPRFLSFVEAVRPHREDRFHWIVRDRDGDRTEWDVDLVEDRPGEALAWRSIPGSDVEMTGVVLFERATGGRGTVVRLGLECAVEKVQPKQELHRFKQWFEAGEVATPDMRKGEGP